MKETAFFLIDAFAGEPFSGNPAGVCLLNHSAEEGWMQHLASEINQAETAFVVSRGDGLYGLRWFTPTVEVELCGHATLAAAGAIWTKGWELPSTEIRFETLSGILTARNDGSLTWLDFPAKKPLDGPFKPWFDYTWAGSNGMDTFVELASEAAVRGFLPDFKRIAEIPERGLLITAKVDIGKPYDFVSRFFAPQSGVDEDAVTGSAHCALAPYWSEKLGRLDLVGYQASSRGGFVHTRVENDRVMLGGEARVVVEGVLR